MNSDPEHTLGRLTARGASTDLRARVMEQVGKELSAREGSRWLSKAGTLVAACLALAFCANIWTTQRHERRLAMFFRPPAVPGQIRALSALVESVTDRETAQAFEQRWLAVSKPPPSLAAQCRAFEKYLRDLNVEWKEDRREKTQKDPRDRSAHLGRAALLVADRQCDFHLHNRFAA